MSPIAVWFFRPKLGRVSQRCHKIDQKTLPDFMVIVAVTGLCDSILCIFYLTIYFSNFSILILAKTFYTIREHLSFLLNYSPLRQESFSKYLCSYRFYTYRPLAAELGMKIYQFYAVRQNNYLTKLLRQYLTGLHD